MPAISDNGSLEMRRIARAGTYEIRKAPHRYRRTGARWQVWCRGEIVRDDMPTKRAAIEQAAIDHERRCDALILASISLRARAAERAKQREAKAGKAARRAAAKAAEGHQLSFAF